MLTLDLKKNNRRNKKLSFKRNTFDYFLAFVFAVSGCVFVSALPSLVDSPVGIASFLIH